MSESLLGCEKYLGLQDATIIEMKLSKSSRNARSSPCPLVIGPKNLYRHPCNDVRTLSAKDLGE